MIEQFGYSPMEPQKSSIVRCAGPIRWSANGKLQQLFEIVDYEGSSPCGTR